MSAWVSLLASFALGGFLAAVYLCALWLGVRRLARRRRPALWLLAGFAARMAVVAAGFLYVARDGHWDRLLAALAGFLVVRTLAVARARRVRPAGVAAPEEGVS